LAARQKGFNLYLLADAEQVSTVDFIRLVADAMAKWPLLVPIPITFLRSVLTASGRDDLADSTTRSLELDTSKARRTGWMPIVTLQQGIFRAIARFADPEI
jgi:UDP-glucose 4-epimerase